MSKRSGRPTAPTVAVPVAAHDLPSGTVLSADDLATRRLPAGSLPAGRRADAVGRTLAGPVRAGEPVTDVRLVARRCSRAIPVASRCPVRIADADVVGLLRVGDHVDLVAADPRRGTASYVAVDVPVLALPAPDGSRSVECRPASPGVSSSSAAVPSDVDRHRGRRRDRSPQRGDFRLA